MDEIAKSITDIIEKDLPPTTSLFTKPISSTSPLRSSTARDRVGNAIVELEALVSDLNTMIKTLGTIKERL